MNTETNINTLHGPLEFPFILNALGWKYFYVGKQSWLRAIWAHTLAQTESGAWRAPDDLLEEDMQSQVAGSGSQLICEKGLGQTPHFLGLLGGVNSIVELF